MSGYRLCICFFKQKMGYAIRMSDWSSDVCSSDLLVLMVIARDASAPGIVDGFGRHTEYLRISVTDRGDLRCRYCMAEKMTFLPRDQLLTLEDIAIIADRIIACGVRKLRLSGGEPLVRRESGGLVRRIGRRLQRGTLQELT